MRIERIETADDELVRRLGAPRVAELYRARGIPTTGSMTLCESIEQRRLALLEEVRGERLAPAGRAPRDQDERLNARCLADGYQALADSAEQFGGDRAQAERYRLLASRYRDVAARPVRAR